MADVQGTFYQASKVRIGTSPSSPGLIIGTVPTTPVNPDGSGSSHLPVAIGSPANGLSITSGQVLSIGLASAGITGALSGTDWSTFNNKQNALVSGTNIKTINGNSLLGSGDMVINSSPIIIVNESSLFSTELVGTGSLSIATNSIFLGRYAGFEATNASASNYLGFNSGSSATNAYRSNFLGPNSGQNATSANDSNFLGVNAGRDATNASLSNLLGYQTGYTFSGNNIGANNIIIGTNISLPNATANAINLGGVLFATGTYANIVGDPSITANAGGRIGILTVTPSATLDVNGDAILSGTSRYLNFNATSGGSGYGFRDNAGTIQWKNSGGSWADITAGGDHLPVTIGSPANGLSITSGQVLTLEIGDGLGIDGYGRLEATGGGSIGAGAGLSLDGSDIQLGNDGVGVIDISDTDVFVDGFKVFYQGVDLDTSISEFKITGTEIDLSVYSNDEDELSSAISLSPNEFTISHTKNSVSQFIRFGGTGDVFEIFDQINSKGLEESSDYSANKTDFSYITPAWIKYQSGFDPLVPQYFTHDGDGNFAWVDI